MNNKRFGALSSSVDPSQLSATVEGLITSVAALLVFFGVISAGDATNLTALVGQLASTVMAIIPLAVAMYGICKTIFGLLRKVVVSFSQKPTVISPITGQPTTAS